MTLPYTGEGGVTGAVMRFLAMNARNLLDQVRK